MDNRPLDEQRRDFSSRQLIAMPIAGMIAWIIVGLGGYFLPVQQAAIVLFVATGMIVYLAMFISRFTDEKFPDSSRPMNRFDALFLHTLGMSLLGYAIAIPFFLADRTSLPLTVGILTGLTWVPISWVVRHWIGIAHAVTRTGAVLAAWYLWPGDRYVVIPAVIVVLYAFAIVILVNRPRDNLTPKPTAESALRVVAL
jgi:hypothetical protein